MSDIKRVNVNGSGSVINPDYDAKLNHTDASLFTADALYGLAGYNPANGINMQNAVDVLALKHSKLESKTVYVANSDSDSDLDLADEEGNVLARFSDGHFQTLNFDSSVVIDTLEEISQTHPYIENSINRSDLSIEDENGNSILLLKDGHIITKSFNSKQQSKIFSSDNSNKDFNICDELGNVLVQFEHGHIKTKNFDSENISYSQFADRPASGYENFLVDVDTNILNSLSETLNLQDNRTFLKDRCLLTIPESYTSNGEPTRLVFIGMGTSGSITSARTGEYHHSVVEPKVFNEEGYATLQLNGCPGETEGYAYQSCGNPEFLRSIVKAYNYIIKKYNIKRDGILCTGWSLGTLLALQVAQSGIIPVKALALFGLHCELWKMMYEHISSQGRLRMWQKFGFTEQKPNFIVQEIYPEYDINEIIHAPSSPSSSTNPSKEDKVYILNNYEKWSGYNPFCYGASNEDIIDMYRIWNSKYSMTSEEKLMYNSKTIKLPCPVRLFTAEDESSAPKIWTECFQRMLQNGHSKCELRVYPSGGHSYPSTTITVQTKYGKTITSKLATWEALMFLERYD